MGSNYTGNWWEQRQTRLRLQKEYEEQNPYVNSGIFKLINRTDDRKELASRLLNNRLKIITYNREHGIHPPPKPDPIQKITNGIINNMIVHPIGLILGYGWNGWGS